MKATQHATNADLIALMAKVEEEENATASEYLTGEWTSFDEETVDDFSLECF